MQIYEVCDDEIWLSLISFNNFHNQKGISSKMIIDYKIIRNIDCKIVGGL